MSFWESNFHYWFLYKNYLNFWKAFCFLFHVNSAFLFHSLVHFTLYTVVSIFCKKKKSQNNSSSLLFVGASTFIYFFLSILLQVISFLEYPFKGKNILWLLCMRSFFFPFVIPTFLNLFNTALLQVWGHAFL